MTRSVRLGWRRGAALLNSITEAAGEVTDGTDQQVRSVAHDEIPILRQHLRLSQDALKAS